MPGQRNRRRGGKTGNTDEAGRCLAAAAEDGDELLISVVLGSGPMEVPGDTELRQGQFRESKRLLEYGLRYEESQSKLVFSLKNDISLPDFPKNRDGFGGTRSGQTGH